MNFDNVVDFLLRVFVLWDLLVCFVMLYMYFDCHESLLFLGALTFWGLFFWVVFAVMGLGCLDFFASFRFVLRASLCLCGFSFDFACEWCATKFLVFLLILVVLIVGWCFVLVSGF